jgi:hypothetical protein
LEEEEMLGWVASLNGAVVASTIAMISFIGYTLLVFRYVLEELMPGILGAIVQTVFVLLLLGGWIWSLSAAAMRSEFRNTADRPTPCLCYSSSPACFSHRL